IEFAGQPTDLQYVASQADYLSIHAPLTKATRHMIGRQVFEAMKPSAILINVARGEIVDEVALIEALRSGKIGGAGLDVFSREPIDPDHPLLKLANVVATNHVAGVTTGTSRRRAAAVAENIRRVAEGLPIQYRVELSA